MFYLKQNTTLLESLALPEVKMLVNDAERRLKDSSDGLQFDEASHTYSFYGKTLRSVSSIVEHYAPVDMETLAKGASKNPKHELYGKSPEEIVAIWKQRGTEAAGRGTKVHSFGEACYLYMTGGVEDIDCEMKSRVTPAGLEALDPKEVAIARWWDAQDWSNLVPVAKETRIVNPSLGYAGTFDLLCYDRKEATFRLIDYKTNKDLEKWFGDYLKPPLKMIKSNDTGKYTVQQTLYTIQLRNIGIDVGRNTLLWLKEDMTCTEVELETKYDKVIRWAVAQMQPVS